MLKKVSTQLAPTAIGPYSQAIIVKEQSSLVFVSGQLPICPQTGNLVSGDIRTQTKQVLENISAILEASSSNLNQVVRCDVFLKDLKNDFAPMNEVYAQYFTSPAPPARQTIQVSDLPKSSPIEISCIAICSSK